jgi:signal transduction histidine kinase
MATPGTIEDKVRRYAETVPGKTRAHQVPDLFARKKMEEELRRAQTDLERRVDERTRELKASNALLLREMEERREMERMLLQSQKLEAVGKLAGGIAHDFNNLLAVIAGNAGLLANRMDQADPKQALLGEITGACKRAASLTQQLLTFSRAQVVAREIVDLNDVVSTLGRMLGRVIGEEIELRVRLMHSAALVHGDRGQLEQVVMNLIVNARDAMPNGGVLTVETFDASSAEPRATGMGKLPAGSYVALRVADNGTGMDSATQERIFDPFFSTKEGKGTGLGLSTVYGIVKESGGGISVTSAAGEGSTFVVYFPRAEAPSSQCVLTPRWPEPARGGERVLVVEDQGPLREVLGQTLRDMGYEVECARDAAEALRIVEGRLETIDLLITDVILPRMRGPELALRLREMRPELKVLFMSGYTDGGAIPEGAALLTKPFSPDELARRIRDVLAR